MNQFLYQNTITIVSLKFINVNLYFKKKEILIMNRKSNILSRIFTRFTYGKVRIEDRVYGSDMLI